VARARHGVVSLEGRYSFVSEQTDGPQFAFFFSGVINDTRKKE
jgi:hypothetical protein